MATAYVEHPVSTEQKKAFLKGGFTKVLDMRFAPDNLEDGDKIIPKKKKEKAAEAKAAMQFDPNKPILNQPVNVD